MTSACASCHGGTAGYSYNNYAATMTSVTAGNAAGSVLYQSLMGSNGLTKMPPGGALSAAQIQTITNWINQGAPNN